tara:strand:- start:318 stop:659 length:342 start_codon:yes stop_codon:yes gene_type:complete
MRTLFVLFSFLPVVGFCQSLPTSLEVQMFNFDKVVVCLDGKQFDCCSKFKLSGISAGDHQLKVYTAKQYVNPNNQTISERLVPIYSGNIYLAKDQKTTCVINEYHQKEIQIRN